MLDLKHARRSLFVAKSILEGYELEEKALSQGSYDQAKKEANDCVDLIREIEDLLEEVKP